MELVEEYERINLELKQPSKQHVKLVNNLEKLAFKIIIDDQKSQDINLIFDNIIDKNQQRLEQILLKLEPNIFGKTTENTIADILDLIKQQLPPELEIIISLENDTNASNKLAVGNNEINIIFKLAKNTKTIKFIVNDVVLSDSEQLEAITNKLDLTIKN